MKIEITHADCNGHEIGDIVDVKGDEMPGWAAGKAKAVEAKRIAVTNPAKGKKARAADGAPNGSGEGADTVEGGADE